MIEDDTQTLNCREGETVEKSALIMKLLHLDIIDSVPTTRHSVLLEFSLRKF